MPKLILPNQTGTHHQKNSMQQHNQPIPLSFKQYPKPLSQETICFQVSAVHQQPSCQSNLMPRWKFLWNRKCELTYDLENILLNNVNTS